MTRVIALAFILVGQVSFAADRPNIILVGAEDISPSFGCYGDPDAKTPNLDRFAAQGARFTRAFTHGPVCAVSRSGLITGMYPTAIGSHHMRSKLIAPPKTFVEELRAAGYFIAWPAGGLGKTDFNFDVPKVWADETKDWTRTPALLPADKPFFAYVNYTVTHESQVRATAEQYGRNTARLQPGEKRDRATVKLPPYYPDTPDVRECVGKYHDNVTALDYTVGDLMKTIDAQPWAKTTVVIFFGDHGWGLPRGKRWCYDSGTRVPLVVRGPGTGQPGTVRDDLVCFLDLAPTLLSLAGAEVPKRMPGRVVLGAKTQPAPEYVFSGRDRMDEAYDRIRSCRGEHYRYVRNFHPELPYAQYINYLDEMPVMKDWRRLAFAGKLDDVQKPHFARTKPAEELYDLRTDPHEVRNMAAAESAEVQRVLKAMRAATEKWIKDTNDLGSVPEKELINRGLVRDLLSTEYDARLKMHPKTPPVPGMD